MSSTLEPHGYTHIFTFAMDTKHSVYYVNAIFHIYTIRRSMNLDKQLYKPLRVSFIHISKPVMYLIK
jgi:hypothetical protein